MHAFQDNPGMLPRFYCHPGFYSLAAGCAIPLPKDAAHHALKVLHLRCGDALTLFDGTGGEYPAHVIEAGRTLRVLTGERLERECEPPLPVVLVQALPGSDKMDWVVQKAVELGVTTIQPVQSRRSVVRLSGERAEKRVTHWRQVAISACEQSGRNRLPEIREILDLAHYLAEPSADNKMILSPRGGTKLAALPRPAHGATILIGPEGGFEEEEERMACMTGFRPVALGPRVLRTETAGLAALAAIMTLWGDF